ncbi:MAG TPA: tetratricopeptide repeat protein [Saprospiraceae bacterium]|nr:tetratricopeptide repeat protein [Saprospiraceae bacterium]
MRSLLSFLIIAFLLPACQNSGSSDDADNQKENEINSEENTNQPEEEKIEWQAKQRSYDAQNELEAEIIRLQDSVDRANFEDRHNIDTMESLIAKMKEHGLVHKNNPRSSAYLLRAGDYAQGLRNFEEAIEILGIILKKYPDSYEYIDALYYTGYIYDRQKKDYKNAVKYYERFIRELPTDDLAPQVQAHLNRVQTIIENEKNNQ